MTDDAPLPARIIIADDHPLFRSALARLFEEHSEFEVVGQAADGREALELCRRLRPELVLMDLGMPQIDGIEATRALKRELPHTSVLMLTAYEEPEWLQGALEAGASGYLLKSAPLEQIIDAVRGTLGGEGPVDQGLAKELIVRLTNEKRESQEPAGTGLGAPSGEPPMSALPRGLTPREVEVLRLLAQGHTNQEIARELLVSTSTVKNHVQRVLTKLGASDRTQAAVMATEMGLFSNH